MFWPYMIAFAVFYAVHYVLSFRQMQRVAREYTAMRRRGRVAVGRSHRLLSAGSVVMLAIDEFGDIEDCRHMTGVTVWAPFRTYEPAIGQNITRFHILRSDRAPKALAASVENARINYIQFVTGGEVQEPETALTHAGRTIKSAFTRKGSR